MLENEKQAKEKERKNIRDLEKQLNDIQAKEVRKNKAATELLREANEKLAKALKNNNLVEANIAQALIQGAQTMLSQEQNLQQEAAKISQCVNKRKGDLINYFTKKPK